VHRDRSSSFDRKIWYVYALCDPLDDTVRYVGQTTDHHRRYAEHLSGRLPHYGGPKQNHPVRGWIRSLQMAGEYPRMRILAVVSSQKNAYREESAFRRIYKRTAINGRAWWLPIPSDHVARTVAARLLRVTVPELIAICAALGIRPRVMPYRERFSVTIISHAEVEIIRASDVYRCRSARPPGRQSPQSSADR
jgi:predicted GIY-YIG superfamily endonuclease